MNEKVVDQHSAYIYSIAFPFFFFVNAKVFEGSGFLGCGWRFKAIFEVRFLYLSTYAFFHDERSYGNVTILCI